MMSRCRCASAVDEFLVVDVARNSWQPGIHFPNMDTMEKPCDDSMTATKTRGFLVVEAAGAPKHFTL